MKSAYVAFASIKIKSAFDYLKDRKGEDKQLHTWIDKAASKIKDNPKIGIKIKKALWPEIYSKEYLITNLWKYDLPNGWRMVYTIKEDQTQILCMILEWFNHKEYDRRFGYAK